MSHPFVINFPFKSSSYQILKVNLSSEFVSISKTAICQLCKGIVANLFAFSFRSQTSQVQAPFTQDQSQAVYICYPPHHSSTPFPPPLQIELCPTSCSSTLRTRPLLLQHPDYRTA